MKIKVYFSNFQKKLIENLFYSLVKIIFFLRKVIVKVFKTVNGNFLNMFVPYSIKFGLKIIAGIGSSLNIRNKLPQHFYACIKFFICHIYYAKKATSTFRLTLYWQNRNFSTFKSISTANYNTIFFFT